MHKFIISLLISVALLIITTPAFADTGTYRITNYIVTLDPQADSSVNIKYAQTWLVTGGGIPWITVGLPNNNFVITDFGGNVSKAYSASSGGWSGIRLDLDRNYTTGQTFNITFTIKQLNLLQKIPTQDKWRISFTPGWYDNCQIDKLNVVLISHSDNQSYVFSPQPILEDNKFVWEKTALRNGERFSVSIESTDGNFLDKTDAPIITAPKSPTPFNPDNFIMGSLLFGLAAIGIVVIIVAFNSYSKYRQTEQEREEILSKSPNKTDSEVNALIIKRRKQREDEEHKRQDDDPIHPVYIAPIIAVGSHGHSHTDNPPSGGGGRSGGGGASGSWSSSCACACVCACACAGGGAAGCTNKHNLNKEEIIK
jgi:hypothetical protein